VTELVVELDSWRAAHCYVSMLVGPVRFQLEGTFDRPGLLYLMSNCGLVCHLGPGVATWLGIPES
jgi:hypothetical protein